MILSINETLKDSIITSNSNNLSYPVVNILDSRLITLYKTNLNTTAEIVFNAGSSVNVSSVNIANHNITSSATILTLEGNNTDVWTSPSFSKTLTWNKDIINETFTTETYQYWRVKIVDTLNPDGLISIGRIWLGEKYNTPNIGVIVAHQNNSASQKKTSKSGQTYLNKKYFYSEWSIEWPIISHTEKAELIEQFQISDIGIPFFIDFEEACLDFGTQYVTMNQEQLSFQITSNTNYYSSSLSLTEEV